MFKKLHDFFFCNHVEDIFRRDETGSYLQCLRCMRKHYLATQFTVSSGIFARIEDRVLAEQLASELRRKAKAYADEMGIEL